MNEQIYRDRLLSLLREADDMWALSDANPLRSVWDDDWNKRRIALLKEIASKEVDSDVAIHNLSPSQYDQLVRDAMEWRAQTK